MILVTAEWPPNSSLKTFTISLSLSRRHRDFKSVSDTKQIVRYARKVLLELFSAILRDHFVLRIDVSRAVELRSPWPRWCLEEAQLEGLLSSIADQEDEDLSALYPISIWIVPRGHVGSEASIELFRALPNDVALWNGVFATGAGRLALFDIFADLVMPAESATQALGWMTTAVDAARGTTPIDWRLEPSQ